MLHTHLSHHGKSSDMFLPLIDQTSSDSTCVQSTLEYVGEHARYHNITPVYTFDQLWLIATLVIGAH